MSSTDVAELRYGRRGGRWAAAAKPVPPAPVMLIAPEASELAEHLELWHGIPAEIIAGWSPGLAATVHAGEHRTRMHSSQEFLGHRHPSTTAERAVAVRQDPVILDVMRRAARRGGTAT